LNVGLGTSVDVVGSNVDLGVSVSAGGVDNLLSDNSGQGNNGNSGQGNNGNGQGNDGVGPGENGQGNNDKGTVVDDVQDLLETLRGKSGKKK
jgi:hypothetical protein